MYIDLEQLLRKLALKQSRAVNAVTLGLEPGMNYWQGYHDAMEAAYDLALLGSDDDAD